MKHPRFFSLLVVNEHGRELRELTQISFRPSSNHIPKDPISDSDSDERQEEKNNSLLADFAISSPLSREKPLWELHLISDLNCAVS